jgi:hypothetical protein
VLAGVGLVLLVGAVCAAAAVVRSKGNDAGQAGNGPSVGPASAADPVQPDPRGEVALLATKAKIHGGRACYEMHDGVMNIGNWNDANDYVTWVLAVP